MIIHSGDHKLSRGVCRTVTGIGRTYTVGLQLQDAIAVAIDISSRPSRLRTAVDMAQNCRITVYVHC